jgi:non-canonical (house-cleaning) NTP pyrophosphatase
MLIIVGTNNKVKVEAVRETLLDYPDLVDADVEGTHIPSGVSEQPWGMEETVQGALNRAVGAYASGVEGGYIHGLGIGIESGTMNTPLGWLNFTAAVICESPVASTVDPLHRINQLWERAPANGIHFGHSTGFPLPPKITNCIIENKVDLDEAVFRCGFSDVPNIGKVPGGFLGLLTRGRISRKLYSQQALQMALISYENKDMFQ